tara:strand:- start:1969 stop:4611 length:2643 start_codon:yes stop_codon:yes gene_type:complete
MQGLGADIQESLDIIIEGLDYQFEVSAIEPDKIKASMASKLTSFKIAKELLLKWYNSPNSPSQGKFESYVGYIINSGNKALKTLRKALVAKIDYDTLDEHKHGSAMESKLVILNSINEMESSIKELVVQLETGTINLKEAEFERGYAEKYACGEFYAEKNYYKEWLNEEEDAIVIDPKGSRGEIIILDDLKVQLPHPPRKKTEILFHDKKKEDQHWVRQLPPRGLTMDNADSFADYILEEYRRRREGIWFFNNGEKVFIPGEYYFYLQWGKIKDGAIRPQFRYSQLDLFYHAKACLLDTRCLGQIFLKSRRTGFTYILVSLILESVMSSVGMFYGITSMTEDDAEKAFMKLSYMFQEMPFFFQPIVRGKVDSPTKLQFGKPSDASKKAKHAKDTTTDGYVNSAVDYESTKVKAYDGQAMKIYLGDESAKWERASYIEHFNTLLPTVFQGGRVVGKVFLGSTMGRLDKGGEDFKVLYLNSKVLNRRDSGFTATKLYSYFLPAHKNYEECIDIYGHCHETKPERPTRNIYGNWIRKGSIQLIQEYYMDAKESGDVALNAAYRAFPMTENHALRDEAESCVFNLGKLTDQEDYNDMKPEHELFVRGTFEWENGIKYTKVVFYPDKKGRFKVSWMPSEADGTMHLRNNVKVIRGHFFPLNDYGCIGVDCYGSYTKGKNKQSKGAAHGYSAANHHGAPTEEFFFEYIDKPATQDIFNDDIIKAGWFYGIPYLAENNRRDFVRYVYLESCGGFSMKRVDKNLAELTGDDLLLGGQPMSGKDMLSSHENAIRTYIQRRVGYANDTESIKFRPEGDMGKMPFGDTITDWKKFDPNNRTAHDATISSGLSIVGTNQHKYKPTRKKADPKKYVPLLRKYSNTGDIGNFIK